MRKGVDSVSKTESFYHKARHKRWRELVLRRAGYLCEECKRYGRRLPNGEPVPAVVAHHKLHADKYPELRYMVGNGRALCETCHNKAHPEKGRKNGYPAPS